MLGCLFVSMWGLFFDFYVCMWFLWLVGWFLTLLPALPNISTITVAGTALVKTMLLNPRTSYYS